MTETDRKKERKKETNKQTNKQTNKYVSDASKDHTKQALLISGHREHRFIRSSQAFARSSSW
jgi:hypothetical protein